MINKNQTKPTLAQGDKPKSMPILRQGMIPANKPDIQRNISSNCGCRGGK